MRQIIGLWVFAMLTMPVVDPLGLALALAATCSLVIAAVVVEAMRREAPVRVDTPANRRRQNVAASYDAHDDWRSNKAA